eukprot:UN00020
MSYFSNAWQTLMVDSHKAPLYDRPTTIYQNRGSRPSRMLIAGRNLSRFSCAPNMLPATGIIAAWFAWPYISYKYEQYKRGEDIW